MQVERLIKVPEILHLTGIRTTKLYDDIKTEQFPPPIKLARTSLWPESEVAAINAARIAGKSDSEIRALVKELVAARKGSVASAKPAPTSRKTSKRPPSSGKSAALAASPRRVRRSKLPTEAA
jgi:prophage regulatory protein